MDIKDLQEIINILKLGDVTEFELESNGTHLRLSRHSIAQIHVAQAVATGRVEPAIAPIAAATAAGAHTAAISEELAEGIVKVEAPLVGTFYRKSSPDAEPFVKEGDAVKKGDTLCIVEAMKLMNEIEAPCSGRIERIMVGDAQVVEYGEVLFLINSKV